MDKKERYFELQLNKETVSDLNEIEQIASNQEQQQKLHGTFKYRFFPLFIRITRNFFPVDISQ